MCIVANVNFGVSWAASNEKVLRAGEKKVRIDIILQMRAVSSGHLFSKEIFCTCQIILFADSEGHDQTARMRKLLCLHCLHVPEDTVSHGATQLILFQE